VRLTAGCHACTRLYVSVPGVEGLLIWTSFPLERHREEKRKSKEQTNITKQTLGAGVTVQEEEPGTDYRDLNSGGAARIFQHVESFLADA
jgi:hypothetical protein